MAKTKGLNLASLEGMTPKQRAMHYFWGDNAGHPAFRHAMTIHMVRTAADKELHAALAEGWILLSEGPSGAQLELPKKMKTQTTVALVIGFVLVLAWGFGLFIIAAALIDYAMQKKQTKFVSRA